jgi:hypothetical protein
MVRLDTDDYAVIVRSPLDGRLYHKYIGPDLTKAEEIFNAEAEKLSVHQDQG